MKITIDTNSDSHNEIRKTIELLQSLLKNEPTTSQSNEFNMGGLDFMNESSQKPPEKKEVKEEEYKTIIID
jgi:hypothetical protein